MCGLVCLVFACVECGWVEDAEQFIERGNFNWILFRGEIVLELKLLLTLLLVLCVVDKPHC